MMRRDVLKLGAASLLASPFTASTAKADDAMDRIAVRWLGGATMEIQIGEVLLLTDPCFGEGPEAFVMPDPNEQFDRVDGPPPRTHARLTPFPGLSAETYDAVLLSHAHEDHFDQTARSWLDKSIPVHCPRHDAPTLFVEGFDVRTMRHGSTRVIQRGNSTATITAIPADHSANPHMASTLGDGNGYYIRAETRTASKTIYWTGDAFFTDRVASAVLKQPAPDLFIPHIGAVGKTGSLGPLSLDAAQAIEGARQLGMRHMLPIHHSTFSLYREPIERVIELHALEENWLKLSVLDAGQAIALS